VQRARHVVARREEHGCTCSEDEADPPDVPGAVTLCGEQRAAGDDPDRTDDQRQA